MKQSRIVVCDDSEPMRRLIREYLRTSDLRVVAEVDTGLGALQAAERISADAMLLDLHLPDVEGTEAVERVRAARPELGLCVYSGAEPADAEPRVLRAGADAFVGKGSGPDRLLQVLRQVVWRRQSLAA